MSAVRSGMIIAAKYRLEESLARGGMGSVWRAQHLALGTDLAIKFIGANLVDLDESRKRFEREAKAAAVLHSPHVVQIHDYGVEDDTPYLVMELLSGEDLGARLAREGRLSPAATTRIVTQVARALRRAAEAGIVHRDLKPSNVFLVAGDEDEELVKVLDFGVAKAPILDLGDDSTKTGAIIGSPRYMSPEQARGSKLVDPRSDLWSLAVIAYRALTGQLPFVGTDVADLIVKICSEPATPPSQIDPSLGPEMDAFFARAFARLPADRFQTARELALAFATAAGEPPPSSVILSQSRPSGEAVRQSARALAPEAPHAPQPDREIPRAAPSGPADGPPPPCEPTRLSERPPSAPALAIDHASRVTPIEPAVSRRSEPAPELAPTPTTFPGSVQVPRPRRSRAPRRVILQRVALGAAIVAAGAVLKLILIVASPSSPSSSTASVADGSIAAPGASAIQPAALVPVSIAPTSSGRARDPVVPSSPTAEPQPPAPTSGSPRPASPASSAPAAKPRSRKAHEILGI